MKVAAYSTMEQNLNPDFSSLVVARRRKGRPGKACDRDHSWLAAAVVLVQYVEEADRA